MTFKNVDYCVHGAKEGGREGYSERVREREGKRERDGEWDKSTQFGEGSIIGPSNRGRVGLTLKLDKLLWIQWPLRSYLYKWNICVFMILVFI